MGAANSVTPNSAWSWALALQPGSSEGIFSEFYTSIHLTRVYIALYDMGNRNGGRFEEVLGEPAFPALLREMFEELIRKLGSVVPKDKTCGKTVRVKQALDLRRFPPPPRATMEFVRRLLNISTRLNIMLSGNPYHATGSSIAGTGGT